MGCKKYISVKFLYIYILIFLYSLSFFLNEILWCGDPASVPGCSVHINILVVFFSSIPVSQQIISFVNVFAQKLFFLYEKHTKIAYHFIYEASTVLASSPVSFIVFETHTHTRTYIYTLINLNEILILITYLLRKQHS